MTGFIIGLFVGATFGAISMAFLVASKNKDE